MKTTSDEGTLTIAQLVGAELHDDGMTWCSDTGESMEQIAARIDPSHPIRWSDDHRDMTALDFHDGSSIICTPGGWDYEGVEPWTFAGLDVSIEKFKANILRMDAEQAPGSETALLGHVMGRIAALVADGITHVSSDEESFWYGSYRLLAAGEHVEDIISR